MRDLQVELIAGKKLAFHTQEHQLAESQRLYLKGLHPSAPRASPHPFVHGHGPFELCVGHLAAPRQTRLQVPFEFFDLGPPARRRGPQRQVQPLVRPAYR